MDNKKNDLSKYIANSLNQKMKTSERVDVDKSIENNENKEKNKKVKLTLKERWKLQKVDEQYSKINWNWKKFSWQTGVGAIMGANSVIYGSSTSLQTSQTNHFQVLINSICDLFSPKSFKDFLWKLIWILPFLLGFIVALIVVFAIESIVFVNGYDLALVFMFIGINIISLMWMIINPKKKLINCFKKENEHKTRNIVLFIFSTTIIFAIAFAARYAWTPSYPVSHLTLGQYMNVIPSETNPVAAVVQSGTIETQYALQILIASFLAGLVTFIPGASGTFMLAVIGSHSFIVTAARFAFSGYDAGIETMNLSWAWSTIVIAFFGIVLGFVASAFLTRYMMNKFDDDVWKAMGLGCSAILTIATLISLLNINYEAIGKDSNLLVACMVLLFVPMSVGIGMLGWFKRDDIKLMFNNNYK